MKWLLLAIWLICGVGLLRCAEQQDLPSLLDSAMKCHQRGLALADHGGSCEERRFQLELLVHSDPDCMAVYRDAGTGLVCIVYDGGGQ